MKRKLIIVFTVLILLGVSVYLYESFFHKGNLVVTEVQESNLSNEVKKWWEESCENKGANIYKVDCGENLKYYLYFEQTGQVNYCKYVVEASIENETLTFKIKEEKVSRDSEVSQSVFVSTELEKEPDEIIVYVNDEKVTYN